MCVPGRQYELFATFASGQKAEFLCLNIHGMLMNAAMR